MRKRPDDSKLNQPNGLNELSVEPLEPRVMLSTTVSNRGAYDVHNIPVNTPTSSNVADSKAGPMSNAADSLVDLYVNYRRFAKAGGSDSKFNSDLLSPVVMTKGKYVGVTVRGRTDLTSLTNRIRKTGGQIIIRSGKYNAIDAVIPINQLRDLASDPNVATINPLAPAQTHAQQGTSNNQAVEALNADKIATRYGLDGTGVKVGVLSNSVNQALGGIAASQATHDLPEKGVQVIDDEFPEATPVTLTGTDDEGRAMLELVHDIAPGADLSFETATPSQQAFAEGIRKLHAAGANVIVDDIGYSTEPFFQPGVIDQAIHDVVADGAVYLSAAGNDAQSGYEAPTNFVTIGSTRYVDFDPGPGVQTKLRVSFPAFIPVPGFPNFPSFVPLFLQWDNPYNGVVGNATTDLDVYAFDPRYPKRILASGTTNNLKTGLPMETMVIPGHSVDIEIRVADNVQGRPLPTRFKFVTPAGGAQISTPFPENERSVFGHSGGPDTISVGAVPFYNAPPIASATQSIASEDFTSVGPVTQIFDSDGNRLNDPQTHLKPDISGVDGTNTSFFTGSGFTSVPLETDITQDDDALPNFFGTSAAAPNVAGVVALIKQAAPNATQAEILSALQATARPTNGTTAGTWDPQGGFGLVDGVAASEQFVTHPTVHIQSVKPDPRVTAVSTIKIIFNQQVTGFDVSDLVLQLDGGPNLLSGGNGVTTNDGGRTYVLTNLGSLTGDVGEYTLTLDDTAPLILNTAGLNYEGGAITETWTKQPTPPRPKAPSNLTAKAISDTEVRLTWRDNEANENGFTIQRAEDEGFSVHVKTFTVDADTTSFDDKTLLPTGKKYFYRVRAFTTFAVQPVSSWSNIASATTLSPGEIILDNDSSSGVKLNGTWTTESAVPGSFGGSYLSDGDSGKGSKSVKYTPNLEAEADYYVYTRWTRATDRATNVPIDIVDADGGVTTVTVNERNTGGSGWVLLGKFHFKQGTFGSVTIRNSGTNGKVIADAVRFLSSTAITPVPPTSS